MIEFRRKMFKDGTQAMINDVDGGLSPMFLDIAFDDSHQHRGCIRISVGHERRVIKYSDLFSFMFMLATPEEQALMMPVQQELGHEYLKQIRIKCKRDMKEGEELVVNVKVHVPSVVEEQIIHELKTAKLTEIKEGVTI